jgi:hypothetical protein
MHYQLSDVALDDADALVRHCQFPAMRHDPLRMIMFPEANSEFYKEEDEEEEMEWAIQGLQESLENTSCYLGKVTYDSTCVGCAIWTPQPNGNVTRQNATSSQQHESWIPKGLDINAWHCVSERLRTERQRALQDKKDMLSKLTSSSYSSLSLNSTTQDSMKYQWHHQSIKDKVLGVCCYAGVARWRIMMS